MLRWTGFIILAWNIGKKMKKIEREKRKNLNESFSTQREHQRGSCESHPMVLVRGVATTPSEKRGSRGGNSHRKFSHMTAQAHYTAVAGPSFLYKGRASNSLPPHLGTYAWIYVLEACLRGVRVSDKKLWLVGGRLTRWWWGFFFV